MKTPTQPKKQNDELKFKAKEGFEERLREVLDTRKQVWWKDKLEVSNSVISFRWQKGSLPKTDKIIRICELTGISANWLLFGFGPKYLETPHDQGDEDHRRRANRYVHELEDKIEMYEERIAKAADDERTLSAFVRLAQFLDVSPPQSLDNESTEELFNRYGLPFFTYFRSLADIFIRMFERLIKSEDGKKFLVDALNFSKNEQEKNEYLYKSRSKELESIFNHQNLFKQK